MKKAHPPSSMTRLLLVVGLTGVGKSTLVDALVARRPNLRLLPNRRELTDSVVIPSAQLREGRDPAPVRDRLERFRLTATYRSMFPGGMTHALTQWLQERQENEPLEAHEHADVGAPRDASRGPCEDPSDHAPGHPRELLFDNLRGLDEVRAAVAAFPAARFLVLDAPPATRLSRLVGRRDPFDHAAAPNASAANASGSGGSRSETSSPKAPELDAIGELAQRLRALPGLEEIFDPDALAISAQRDGLDADALVSAAAIIVEEQRNYDNTAAAQFLAARLPPERLRIVDTATANPSEATELVLAWLREGDDA